MCTVIIGLEVLGPHTLVFGANRDESPDRPATGPGVLLEHPRVVGGRDLLSGGTWLAIREGHFITALMNRRPLAGTNPDPSKLRSRGLLCLEAAAANPPLDAPAAIDPGTGEAHPPQLDAALRLLHTGTYAHCTLVGVQPDGGWAIHAGHGGSPEVASMGAGWHVITHQDLDDTSEPRTAYLMRELEGMKPGGVDAALSLVGGLLSGHGENGEPPVCLHRDRFPTVSSSVLALGAVGRHLYLHAPGPPCVTPYQDYSGLLM